MSTFWNLVTIFGILMKKCIQKSPNMPGIGSLILEIDVTISEIWETNILFLLSKTNTCILSVLSMYKYYPMCRMQLNVLFLNQKNKLKES